MVIRHVLALAALPLLTGACAGTAAEVDPAATPLSTVRVGLTEWAITVPEHPVAPGRVAFRVTNVGATAHDLVVRGGLGTWRTPALDPGETTELAVRVRAGEELHLDCTVAGHHAAGMHTSVPAADTPVSEASRPGTGGPDHG